MSESPEEQKEKASLLAHIARATFPIDHLAPWLSIGDKRDIALRAALLTTADIAIELDRRVWLDDHPVFEEASTLKIDQEMWKEKHPGEPLPKDLEDKPTDDESDPPDSERPEFEPDRVRGAAGMFGFCMKKLAMHTHDLAPSVNGIGRRQAIALGQAQKTGVASEPKPRTFFERVTGRGKDREKVSGS